MTKKNHFIATIVEKIQKDKPLLGILLVSLVWTIDFASTVYGVEYGGLIEANKIQAYTQGFGWINSYIIGITFLALSFYLIKLFVYKKIPKKLDKYKINIYSIPVGIFFTMEIFTIINNINLILA